MLPFGLVLFFAASALAAPAAQLSLVNAGEYPPSNSVIDNVFSIYDGGDTNVNILTVQENLKDLERQGTAESRPILAAQTLALLGELIPGNAGDSCVSAALANAYSQAAATGNWAIVRQPLAQFIGRMQYNIDLITQLANNNVNLRFQTGPRGNCQNGGKIFDFEGAWSSVLRNYGNNPAVSSLLNEQYCTAGRLYNSFNNRSNNVGAAVTAASTPSVVNVVAQALPAIDNFLQVVASGRNPASAANAAKKALASARY